MGKKSVLKLILQIKVRKINKISCVIFSMEVCNISTYLLRQNRPARVRKDRAVSSLLNTRSRRAACVTRRTRASWFYSRTYPPSSPGEVIGFPAPPEDLPAPPVAHPAKRWAPGHRRRRRRAPSYCRPMPPRYRRRGAPAKSRWAGAAVMPPRAGVKS
jgi:hypothetical protein